MAKLTSFHLAAQLRLILRLLHCVLCVLQILTFRSGYFISRFGSFWYRISIVVKSRLQLIGPPRIDLWPTDASRCFRIRTDFVKICATWNILECNNKTLIGHLWISIFLRISNRLTINGIFWLESLSLIGKVTENIM